MIHYGATHNVMPLSFMRTIGLDCTRHCQASECIFAIDSRSVTTYEEIKICCARISSSPTIHIVFTIIVVNLPSTYTLVLGRGWSYPLGDYLMNDGSCMMLLSKDGGITRIPHETKKPVCFERKEEVGMDNFLDLGLENYVVLEDITNKMLGMCYILCMELD